MKLQELVSGSSSKLRIKKPSLSDTYKDDKTYREEIDNLHGLIDSKNTFIESLDQAIKEKQQELNNLDNKNNLEFEQAELLKKEYLDYAQAIKVTSIEAKNAEQGTLEKRDILEKLALEESVLRRDLIDIQDKVSASNSNLSELTSKTNEKINEGNETNQKLLVSIENLKVVENNLGVQTSSLKKIESTIGEKEILLKNFITEAEIKQKEIVPIDDLLREIHEKQELVYQLTAQAEELKTILDDGAKLSLSFQSTIEETEKKQRLRHRLLLLEIKDLDVVVSEKLDYISELDDASTIQKESIESHKESIQELMKEEQKLRDSLEDIEFRKFVKTSPEVSVVPTLGVSESPFHKKTGVS